MYKKYMFLLIVVSMIACHPQPKEVTEREQYQKDVGRCVYGNFSAITSADHTNVTAEVVRTVWSECKGLYRNKQKEK